MKNTKPLKNTQSGFMLLEALIAILIFSFGVLALVALQARSIQLSADAKYRTNATLLANQLIGQMWVSGEKTPTALKAAFDPSKDAYKSWLAEVKGENGLPGVMSASSGVVATLPIVTISDVPGPTLAELGQVTITLFWRTPEMNPGDPGHRHVVVSQIAINQP